MRLRDKKKYNPKIYSAIISPPVVINDNFLYVREISLELCDELMRICRKKYKKLEDDNLHVNGCENSLSLWSFEQKMVKKGD